MKIHPLIMLTLLAVLFNAPAHAISDSSWEDISDIGAYTLVGAALIVPITRDDTDGLYQATYSLSSAIGVSLLGKALVDEERPDNSDNDSFPSGHTASAFASATTLHRRYGWQTGLPAYALATLTGISRERARQHYWWDVVAGAAIGTATGWFFTDAVDDNVQLVPWVSSKGGGITVSMRW
jgi:membrane-associated phospholipid phosphatase